MSSFYMLTSRWSEDKFRGIEVNKVLKGVDDYFGFKSPTTFHNLMEVSGAEIPEGVWEGMIVNGEAYSGTVQFCWNQPW